MRGRITGFNLTLEQKQLITVEIDGDFTEQYEALKDADIDLSVKKWRKKRSNDANAYAWVLIDKIASAMSLDKETVYRNAIRDIGGVSEVVCVQDAAVEKLVTGWKHNGVGWHADKMPSKIEGCTNVVLYYGSSTYDTKQMSNLINHLVDEAKDLGIETMPPYQLSAMIEQFENRQKGK